MGSFKEFLKEYEGRFRAEEATREVRRHRWEGSVTSLLQQMETWLQEFDADGLLRVERKVVQRDDESIGIYHPHALDIRLGHRVVSVEPVAHDVLGPVNKPGDGSWSGRVDLVGAPYKFELYRFTGRDGSDSWYIRDTRNYRIAPFEKKAFDEALVELFA